MGRPEHTPPEIQLQTSPEVGFQEQTVQLARWQKAAAWTVLAATTWASVHVAIEEINRHSGEVVTIIDGEAETEQAAEEPIVLALGDAPLAEADPEAAGSLDDRRLVVATWNIANQITGRGDAIDRIRRGQIEELKDTYGVDAQLLQETTEAGSFVIAASLPEWRGGKFGIGEGLWRGEDKPELGNALFTEKPLRDVESVSLDGSSKLVSAGKFIAGGIVDGLEQLIGKDVDVPWRRAMESWEENRGATGATFDELVGNEVRSVRLTTLHLSHHLDSEVKEKQFEQIREWLLDNPPVDIDIVCGDFNAQPEVVQEILDWYEVLLTGPTMRDRTFDMCLVKPLPDGLVAEARVVKGIKSDHHPVVIVVYEAADAQVRTTVGIPQ